MKLLIYKKYTETHSAFIEEKEYFKNKLIEIYLNNNSFKSADVNFDNFIYNLDNNLGAKLFELVNNANIKEEDISNIKFFKNFYDAFKSKKNS